MRVKMEVLGIMDVQKLIDSPANFNILRAFQRSGLVVEHNARMKSPYRTGHLRRNIIATATKDYAEIGVSLNVVPYAWYQEAGTSKMPAHPYLRPGLASSRKEIIAVFKDEIDKAIRRKK